MAVLHIEMLRSVGQHNIIISISDLRPEIQDQDSIELVMYLRHPWQSVQDRPRGNKRSSKKGLLDTGVNSGR